MPMGPWRRLATLSLGLALASVVHAPRADAADAKLLHHKARSFRIPITVDPKFRAEMKEVRLYVSTDSGGTWDLAGRMKPDEPSFTYKAPRDGEYWFAVRTVDLQGRPYPAGERPTEPMLRVVVDTTPPTIDLQPLSRVGTRAAVRWEVQDEGDNLALDTLTLQYQSAGALDYASVPIRKSARIGEVAWEAGMSSRLKVRATIRDKAGNVGVAEIVLPEGVADNPSGDVEPPADEPPARVAAASRRSPAPAPIAEPEASPVAEAAEAAAPATARPASSTLLVGSPRFPLQYDVQDAGPGGAALVELWTTRDGGRTWSRQPEDADHRSPYDVDLGGEGTFGLWLVVQGASGLGDLPPAPGDRPQTWVEVDASPPTVQLDPPRPGGGRASGNLTITWRVADAHLASPRPIAIFYRPDTPDAPWQPIARVENTGKYNWPIPAAVPPRFHIRVEAQDAAGHRAAADTTETGAVTIDRARPKGRILGLDPAAKLGAGGQYRR